MTAPGIVPARMECRSCGETLTQVVLSSVSQMFTPQAKVLRQTFKLHGVALAKARPRMLVVQCPQELTPVEGPDGVVALGDVEVAEYERLRRALVPEPVGRVVVDGEQPGGAGPRQVVPAEVRAPRRAPSRR